MIHNTLDLASEPMLTPEMIYGKQKKICDICIVTFSPRAVEWALNHLDCREIGAIECANDVKTIYMTQVNGVDIAFYMTLLSSAAAAACLEEARCLIGAEHYVMFGSCGSLDHGLTDGRVIVPTHAYRDEGLSYHYLPAEEYVELENADLLAEFMDKNKIAYVIGKTWTTDAIYRETKNKIAQRRADGCIVVEMESAGAQAVCKYHGWHFYNFLFAGDFFGEEEWNMGNLGGKAETDLQIRCFQIALEFAAALLKS